MGTSIDHVKSERIERNRAEGRLCSEGSRVPCSIRATRLIVQRSWMHRIDEGPEEISKMPMCGRHAKLYPTGYRGVNFIVTGNEQISRNVEEGKSR